MNTFKHLPYSEYEYMKKKNACDRIMNTIYKLQTNVSLILCELQALQKSSKAYSFFAIRRKFNPTHHRRHSIDYGTRPPVPQLPC